MMMTTPQATFGGLALIALSILGNQLIERGEAHGSAPRWTYILPLVASDPRDHAIAWLFRASPETGALEVCSADSIRVAPTCSPPLMP